MPEPEVLVICSKGGLPQWRQTIARSGLSKAKVSLINFERTKSLLAPLPKTTRRSTRAKNRELAKSGTPKAVWRLVVIDEAHRLRNPYAQQSMVCRQIVAAARFTLFISATAGQAPHELSYLGGLLGAATGTPMQSLADFRLLMQRLEIGKAKGRWTNWSWSGSEVDRGRMAQLLYTGRQAIGLRRLPQDIAGWPDVQRELAPTALSPDERRLYALTWRDFRHELGLLGGSRRRAAGWAATLRFRQKASLLRIGGTADFAENLLADGHQVAISVAYLETSAMLAAALRGRGWAVCEYNGTNEAAGNEAARVAFQTGACDIVIFTVTESISLHRNEMPGGGRHRSLIIHDMRHSAIQLQQIEGRCHRDGEQALIYYAFAEDTVEERITATVVERVATMDAMAGDDTSAVERIILDLYAAIDRRTAPPA